MPQDTQRTAELLESLLSGQELPPDRLDDLLRCKVREDLHLDYKHGKELEKRGKAPAQMIREYVSGFANGAGGVLLVGVDEEHRTVTGCEPPDGGSLTRWASSCVVPIAGYLSPPPIYGQVEHANGDVLVVAVARSPVLVPCFEKHQKPTYYLRMDDKTLSAPEYLVADLVLGRRQHAYLTVAEVEAHTKQLHTDSQTYYDWQLHLRFVVENQGLSGAEQIGIGIVGLHSRLASRLITVSNYLHQHVEVQQPVGTYRGEHILGLHLAEYPRLEPFRLGDCVTNGMLSAPLSWAGRFYTPYEWKAAVYLIAEQTPPTWYQLSITINSDLLQYLKSSDSTVSSAGPFLSIERLAAGRPVVGWVGDNI